MVPIVDDFRCQLSILVYHSERCLLLISYVSYIRALELSYEYFASCFGQREKPASAGGTCTRCIYGIQTGTFLNRKESGRNQTLVSESCYHVAQFTHQFTQPNPNHPLPNPKAGRLFARRTIVILISSVILHPTTVRYYQCGCRRDTLDDTATQIRIIVLSFTDDH